MSNQSPLLVSIGTPMYNNVEECIESVRAQTYGHWEYVIVNNCSTDGSAEIARRFAAVDLRIRALDNQELLEPAELNHNHALRQISAASKYCKMVFSDDWLFPHCLLKDAYIFGSPHSMPYRSDLVWRRNPDFNVTNSHADQAGLRGRRRLRGPGRLARYPTRTCGGTRPRQGAPRAAIPGAASSRPTRVDDACG